VDGFQRLGTSCWEVLQMARVKRIDHVAVLVSDMDKAVAFWQEALGIELARVEEVPRENSRIAFFHVGGTEIELVQPTTGDSGLARYLERRGPGLHHVCLEVDDIEGMLARLRELGVQLISESPMPGEGGKRYAFVHPKAADGVMVELYELPR
jgi:methylmalonyl-CoA/ethylmalonyl-CoA epimerase